MNIRAAVLTLGIMTAASTTRAQNPARVAIPFRTYVAVNPLGIPFDIGSIEVESGVAQGITVGGVASYTSLGDDRYTTLDLKFRYYPSEVVLDGFALGLSIGRTHLSTLTFVPATSTEQRTAIDFPTLGILVDYNWMLGARRRFVVGTGLGAKRVLASSERRDPLNVDPAYVTARFVVGLAF